MNQHNKLTNKQTNYSTLFKQVEERKSETRLQFQGQAINFDYERLASGEKSQRSLKHMA